MAAKTPPSRSAQSRAFLRRPALLAGSSVAAILLSTAPATAQQGPSVNFFGGGAGANAAQAARAASGQANRQAGAAAAVAQRTREALGRATQVRQAMADAQTAARAAAIAGTAGRDIPNGLGRGGLQVADGVTFDPGAIGLDDPRLGQGNLWVGANGPTQTTEGGRTVVEIDQTQSRAILNWETFNVGRDTTVRFDQSAGGANVADWIALNRINDPDAAPSQIFGNIEAQGQVYLINRNGVMFGGTSQVNVRSLTASALDFYGDTAADRDARFLNGILFNGSPGTRPELVFGERFEAEPPIASVSNPNPAMPDDVNTRPGEVLEGRAVAIAAGARINTDGGRAMFVGHNVSNAGSISAADGEVVLAAGRGVYLNRNYGRGAFSPIDPALRGITVGVNRGGRIENSGSIVSDRGSINFQAKNILQDGLLQATTSATANGLIQLTAGDGLNLRLDNPYPEPVFAFGDLTFGEGSTTQILPDSTDGPAIGFDQFQPSRLDLRGRYVTFERDSTVFAPGAAMNVLATRGQIREFQRDPVTGQPLTSADGTQLLLAPDDGRIYIDDGVTLNLGGLRGVEVAMERNTIAGELRASELRDNPVLRDSFARGRDVFFDARRGTDLADLSGYYDLIERDVAELMTNGGSLNLSGAEVITRDGSNIDLSGGSLSYRDGFVRSTLLIDANGNIVPIENADPNVRYVGFYGDYAVDHERWGVTETYSSAFFSNGGQRFERGYIEGRNAGSLTIGAPSTLVLDGGVTADVVVGQYQRDPSTGATAEDVAQIWRERPVGAALNIGFGQLSGSNLIYSGGNIRIGEAELLPEDFRFDTAASAAVRYDHVLSSRLFDGNTFANVNLFSGNVPLGSDGVAGTLTIEEGAIVDLGEFGEFNFGGTRANIDGTIRAEGGSVAINAIRVADDDDFDTPTPEWRTLPDARRPGIVLGGNAVIDVAGRLVNDFTTLNDRPSLAIDGGSVILNTGYDLILNAGSVIDVSGGGHLAADGRTVTPGDAGSITLSNAVPILSLNSAPQGPRGGQLVLDADLRGHALGRGGSLTIATDRLVSIGDAPVLADGVLPGGTVATDPVTLADGTVLPAGADIAVPFAFTLTRLPSGVPLPVAGRPSVPSEGVTTGAAWTVPTGVNARGTSPAFTFYPAGAVVPAGTRLSSIGGTFAIGSVIPADVFPDGLGINQPTTVNVAAGPLARPLAVPALTTVPAGSRFAQAVEVVAPLNLAPSTFTQGGFAAYQIAGAQGVVVQDGTRITPTVESFVLDRSGRDIASGSSLFGRARTEILAEPFVQPMSLTLANAVVNDLGFAIPEATNGVTEAQAPGAVRIGTGARIDMAPESTVRLVSANDIFVDGVISTPGGAIDLDLVNLFGSTRVPTARLGANARLLATGYERTVPVGDFLRRSIEAGGTVTIGGPTAQSVNRSLVVTDAASVIDVSGVRGMADFLAAPTSNTPGMGGPYVGRMVDGAAGSVAITGSGGVLGGELRLAPGGETGRGGRLEINVLRGDYNTLRVGAPTLTVTADALDAADGLRPVTRDGMVDPNLRGIRVSAGTLNASGADDLVLKVDSQATTGNLRTGALLFDGDVTLNARRSIQLGGPLIAQAAGANNAVTINADQVIFSLFFRDSFLFPVLAPALPTDLSGSFTVNADVIDVRGGVDFGCGTPLCRTAGLGGGFADVNLNATRDIRLDAAGQRNGVARISAGGRLNLDAAQVYVTRGSRVSAVATDPGFLVNAGQSINISSNGAETSVPFAFGERLTLRAPDIVQGGVVRAPLGEIRLEGSNSVTLAPGSLTSTSLEGLVLPAGIVTQLDLANQFPGQIANGDPATALARAVRLTGPDVTVAEGAVIDVSGGGDLFTTQFVAGNTGSRNILLDPGMFAILPSLGDNPAPGGAVGERVYLDGIPGLPAGEYTLLPPEYALMEGGVLIQAQDGGLARSPETLTRPDGASLVGGYRLVDGTPIRDAGFTRFLVLPQEVFTQFSELNRFSYNDFVAERAELAGITARAGLDAGTVVLGATRNLVLNGTGRFGAAEGGLLGNLDISTQRIAITGADQTAAPAGYLAIDARRITGFGAGSVFIGGTRAQSPTGTTLTVNATDVIVSNGADSALVGPEILIGARNNLIVQDGAVIRAEGQAITDTNPLLVAGNGALLRATTGDRVRLTRTGANGTAGVLDVRGGATLAAAGSLSLDASRSLLLDPDAVFDADQLDLSSVRVSIGDVPDTVAGTVLSGATLANLSNASDLLIRGIQGIDLYGDFALGSRGGDGEATLGALTLDTASLNGLGAAGDTAAITAGRITLTNAGAAATAPLTTTGGDLRLDTDALILGPGQIDVSGFGRIDGRAGRIEAQGTGGFDFAGPMSVATDLVTAAAGSDYGLRVVGDLALTRLGGDEQEVEEFGGRLSIEGRNLTLDTAVGLPAGVFEARATGGNLTLGQNADISVAGHAVDFRDVVRVASGGLVRLGATGGIAMADGAGIDVSGHERGGDAGWVEITAGGAATLDGDFTGQAADGFRGGGLILDAGSLGDFAGLNAALEAGEMNRARSIRVRTGDLNLAAGQTLTARDVLLRADAGAVTVAGTIAAMGDAASPDGGRIRLIGGNGVGLASTARLDARAGTTEEGDFEADSGFIELAATGGRLNVASGAVVDVSGGRQGGGEILVRADRVGADIAIDRLDGQFVGARDLGVAGVHSYQTASLTAAQRDLMFSDAAAWMGGAAAMQARIGAAGFEIRPGISVESAGDLAIATDIDLSNRRYGAGAPGYLDFTAAGDILINGNISDGFAGVARNAAFNTGRSWSYGFEAGRDVTLGAGRMVRTGTGDIRIDAGRDLVFASNTSVLYTAGSRTATAAGFTPLVGRVTGEFPTQGGDISLRAGRDIVAPVANQSASGWLFRYGDTEWTADPDTSTVAEQTSWSIVFGNFEQGVGALGGGNVDISVGRDYDELVVALPTTGHMTTTVGGVAGEDSVVQRGGGDLSLRAGRDIEGGVFLLGRGQAEVEANGRMTVGDTLVAQRSTILGGTSASYAPRAMASLWGLMDATLQVEARASAEIEAAFDPMLQGQICQNSLCSSSGDPTAGSGFYGMTDRTSMQVVSASGDVRYNANPWASIDLTRGTSRVAVSLTRPLNDPRPTLNNAIVYAPGDVDFAALSDDIVLGNRFGGQAELILAPTDNGNLEFLATGGIRGDTTFFQKNVRVVMSDVGKDYRRNARHAFRVNNDTRMNIDINVPQLATNYDRGFTLAHINDLQPARFYSMTDSLADPVVVTPKAMMVYSGKDLSGFFTAQNNRPTDVSSFVAERDTDNLGVLVTGSGDAVIEAGRDLKRSGAVSAGQISNLGIESTRNLALPENDGADIYMIAGTAKEVDYDGFLAAYTDTANGEGVVRTYLVELAAFMKGLGFEDLSEADLVARFADLPLQNRKVFAQQVFFSELRETGLDVTDPDSPRFQNYERGYDAVKRLFPLDTEDMADEDRANIILAARAVETQAGGNITLLAPYGRIEVGGLGVTQPPEQGGVVTRKGGDIRIMADQDIALFSSRVFTLQGGDITMWTSNGDITAGVGAKTTAFRPPLVYSLSNSGLVSVNVFGLQTGAGIGVLDAGGTGEREESRLDLIAPRGEVNAGDAGIRVVGNLNIAALRVVGLDNIQVSGESTGLPELVAVNVGALTAASTATAAVNDAAEELVERNQRPVVRDVPSIITVEILGFGE